MCVDEVLKSDRLILRPFTELDVEDVYEYASDAETVKFLTFRKHECLEETLEVIRKVYMVDYLYAIESIGSGKCIGAIDIRLDKGNDKASFGYVLNRSYWGQGYMTEALSRILKVCFEDLRLNRVESTHYVSNEGSGMVMKKCGMRCEGLGIDEIKIKGKYFDVKHYAILKKEYEAWSN